MKNIKISLIFLTVSIFLFVLIGRNKNIIIALQGYSPYGNIVYEGYDQNERKFIIMRTIVRETEMPVILHLQRNALKHWEIADTAATEPMTGTSLIHYGWGKFVNHQFFQNRLITVWKGQRVVFGNNAIAMIENLELFLPNGIAVNILQNDHEFLLHLIHYDFIGESDSSPSPLFTLDIEKILLDNGFINEMPILEEYRTIIMSPTE
ncbi:MAG: hypothetical protein FWF59_00710 [Turicibacter sp.]|nr:hypothetical protein [Turicibacter sp.]